MVLRPVVAVAVLALLPLAACGEGSDSPTAPDRSASPAPPDPTLTSASPTGKPSASGSVLTGVVGEADENNCLTLTTTDAARTTWLLVGQIAGITAGSRVTVRGSPAPGLATRCQQGTPFVVETVEPG